MSDLVGLLERVKSATGADRDLDLALHCAFYPNDGITKIATGYWRDQLDWGVTAGSIWNRTEFGSSSIPLPAYTASVDAALALVERLLPGWTIAHLSQQDDKSWFCEMREGFLTSYSRVAMSETAHGKRPANLPLAILAALLTALIAKEPQP